MSLLPWRKLSTCGSALLQDQNFKLAATLAWFILKARCDKVLKGPLLTINRAITFLKEFQPEPVEQPIEQHVSTPHGESSTSVRVWCPLHQSALKVNVDGAIRESSSATSAVARDHEGRILVISTSILYSSDPEEVEAFAANQGEHPHGHLSTC